MVIEDDDGSRHPANSALDRTSHVLVRPFLRAAIEIIFIRVALLAIFF